MKKVLILILLIVLSGCGGGGGGDEAPSPETPSPEVSPPSYWAKSFGGDDEDRAYSIQQTSDGGYIIAGSTMSFDAEDKDFWVVKIDSSGEISWEKRYEGAGEEVANSIQQTSDGEHIVAGYTASSDGSSDILIMKLNNSDGGIMWAKTYDKDFSDTAYSIQQTNNGYIVAGTTMSSADIFGDILIMELNSDGSISWAKTYDLDINVFTPVSIQQTNNGYIVAGTTMSFGGGSDFLVMKLNLNGGISWAKTYDNNLFLLDLDIANSVQQTNEGGHIVAGVTPSSGGNSDILVMKLDSEGNILWTPYPKTYGGSGEDIAYSIQQTDDGGYIVAGATDSFGEDKDFWLIKLDSNGNIPQEGGWQKTYGGTNDEEARSIKQTNEGGYIVAGWTKSFDVEESDFWVLSLKSDGTVSSTYTGDDTDVTPQNATVGEDDVFVTPIDVTNTIITNDIDITVEDTEATVQTQASD